MKVRNVKFDFSETPRYWILNNSVATHFINSMHVVFPEGEKFFIRSVRKFYNNVDDKLKKDIDLFCGQEGIHAREHQKFWSVMQEQGLEPEVFAKFLKETAFGKEFSVEKIIQSLNLIQPELGDKLCLSLTSGLEHYTAILAHSLFLEPLFSNQNISKEMVDLLHWHAAEEIEHKSVCFDVLDKVDSRYSIRIVGMILATLLLWSYLGIGFGYFMWKDKEKSWLKSPSDAIQFLNIVVNGEVGKTFRKNLWEYFIPNFHPNDIKDGEVVKKFFSHEKWTS